MKKILAMAVVIVMMFAVCAATVFAATDTPLYTGTVSTGWWMNPFAGDDWTIGVKFNTPNAFDGFNFRFYANGDAGAEVVINLLDAEGGVLETQNYTAISNGSADITLTKVYESGTYEIQFKSTQNGAHFVLGSGADSDIAVEISGNAKTNANTQTAPAITLHGANAQQGGETPAPESDHIDIDLTAATGSSVELEVKDGKIIAKTTGGDPWVSIPVDEINTSVYKYFTILYRADKEIGSNNTYLKDTSVNPNYSGTQGTWLGNGMQNTADGELHVKQYNIEDFPAMVGTKLTGVRFTACGDVDGLFTIEGLVFSTVPYDQISNDTPADPGDTPADPTPSDPTPTNPTTADASVIAIAAVACIALAGVAVAKKVR